MLLLPQHANIKNISRLGKVILRLILTISGTSLHWHEVKYIVDSLIYNNNIYTLYTSRLYNTIYIIITVATLIKTNHI